MLPVDPTPRGPMAAQAEFQATAMAVRDALAGLRQQLQSKALGPGLIDTAEQVLAEVLNNVVEHAHAGRPDGIVRLAAKAEKGALYCEVQDDGAPMPGKALPEGRMARIGGDLQSLPEGGFGWFMIRKLTRDLTYCRRDGWNHLSFRILVEPGSI